MASGPDANTTSHMIPALVIASCSGGGSGDCGGGHVASCCGGCMAWWSWSHGLMVAMAGGGCGSCSCVTEVAAVVPHHVVVAAWRGGCGHGHMA
jgi:hypothetical protein